MLTNDSHYYYSVCQVEDKYNVDTIIDFPQNKNMINALFFLFHRMQLPFFRTRLQRNSRMKAMIKSINPMTPAMTAAIREVHTDTEAEGER